MKNYKMKNEKYKLHLFIQNNVRSTKSTEGATPNRAVRKGCYNDDFFSERRRCDT